MPPIILLAVAAAGPGPCVMDEDTKRFPDMGQTAYFRGDAFVVRPGDTISLTAEWRDGPFGEKQLPLPCLQKWSVDPKQATLAKDRRTLRIADDVPAGSVVAISAMIGKQRVTGTFRITGRDEKVLYGKWTEASSSGCGKGARRVAELVFG